MVENRAGLPIPKELLERSTEMLISFPVPDIPQIKKGDDIGAVIIDKMSSVGGIFEKDIYVVASKIISKAEGQIVDLTKIKPSDEAKRIFEKLGRKSPELIQLILDQAENYEVRNGVIVTKHKLGFILTSAGVDGLGKDNAIILPENPDQSALQIMNQIRDRTGKSVAIVISDSEGRPDRKGAGAISIGVAGIDPLRIRQTRDESGASKTTEETISDMLAAQASLLMGQRGNNIPVVCIRGFKYDYNPNAKLQTAIHK